MLLRAAAPAACRAAASLAPRCAPVLATLVSVTEAPLRLHALRPFSSSSISCADADAGATSRSSPSTAASGRPSAAAAASISLQHLQPTPGSSKDRRRKGRGHGSGMGKYATRGMKGAKSRAGGGVKPTFEGGQTPLHRRTPKLGYMPAMLDTPFEPVNLEKLQLWIDSGRIDASRKITMRVMLESGLLSSIKHGVKLLARGTREGRFAAPGLDIEVSQASAAAIEAVEAAGGSVKSVYLTPLALRAHLQPAAKFDVPIQAPLPPPKLMKLYTSYEHRGYLSPEMQLREIKQRLAAGVPHEKAVQVLPVYVGGPIDIAEKAGLAPASSAAAAGQ